MLYEIRYADLVSVRTQIVSYIAATKKQLDELGKSYTKLLESGCMQGETAETLYTYISAIHGSIMSLIGSMLDEYQNKLLVYENGLHEIEADRDAIIFESELTLLSDGLERAKKKYGDITDEVANTLNSVNDIYSHAAPDSGSVYAAYRNTMRIASNFQKEVGQYEHNHRNDCDQLKEYIAKITDFISSQTKSQNDTITLENVKEVVSGQAFAKLAEMDQQAKEFAEANQVALGKEYDLMTTELEEEKAKQREIDGLFKVLTGALVVGSIIVTAGAATPLVVALDIGAGIYAAAEVSDGLQDIYGGATGDGFGKSFNFLRDGVIAPLAGEEHAQAIYEVLGIAVTVTGASVSMLAKKGVEITGKNLAQAVAKEGIKTLVSTGTGYGAGEVVSQLGANDGQKHLVSMLVGLGTNLGLSQVDGLQVKDVSTEEIKDPSGLDWYKYFRDKYGKQNVCWENCDPSKVASAWQGSYPYTGVDSYTNIVLHDGDIIWMGEPYPTGYSTTAEAIEGMGNDAQKVFKGLQVKPYYEDGMTYAEYRGMLTPYQVKGELAVADGVAMENPQFGAGGLAQRFDPNFDFNVATGNLVRLDKQAIDLVNTKISLGEYFKMMDDVK